MSGTLELEHAVGYNAAISPGLFLHQNGREYLCAAGGCVVVGDLAQAQDQVFLRGHDSDISALALSSTGKFLVSGQTGLDSDVVVWDLENRRSLHRFEEHDHGVACVAFSPDEKLCITLGVAADRKLIVWDMVTGNIVINITNPFASCNVVACGGNERDIKRRPTHRYVFATGGINQLILWTIDPFTGEILYDKINSGHAGRDFTCLAFSDDGEYLYAGTSTGDFACVHVRNRIANSFISVCSGGVFSLCVTDNNRRIIVGGGDGSLTAFAGEKTQWVSQRKVMFQGAVSSISLSANGLEGLVGTRAGYIYRIRPSDFASTTFSENHYGAVADCSFPTGISDRIATISNDGTLRIWDLNNYKGLSSCVYRNAGNPAALCYLGELLISGWSDGRIRGADSLDGSHLWQIDNAHRGGVGAIVGGRNARFFATGGHEGEIRVWEIAGRKMVVHMKEHTARVTGMRVFDDDAHLLTCSRDKSFLCWDLRREKRVASYIQRMGGLNDAVLANDQATVLTVGSEKKVTYWDLRQPEPVRAIEYARDHEATTIAFSHDNRFFVTGGTDQAVRLWDFRTGRPMNEGLGHSGTVSRVRFSPDDRQVVSVGADGCIFVWNVFDN